MDAHTPAPEAASDLAGRVEAALASLKRGDLDLLTRAYRSSGGGVFGGMDEDWWKLNAKAARLVALGLAREKPNAPRPQQYGYIITTPLGNALVEARTTQQGDER